MKNIKQYKLLFGGGLVFFMFFIISMIIISPIDTQAQTSSWTVQTLKEYTDSRFEAISVAIEKADAYTKYRDEKQNEFRGALDDASNKFAAKENVSTEMEGIKLLINSNHDALSLRIENIEIQLRKTEDMKTGGDNTIAYWMAGISFLLAIFAFGRNFILGLMKQSNADKK